MHYIAILALIGVITVATGGHSATFGEAYRAAVDGDVDEAVDLFTAALRRTLRDADPKLQAACTADAVAGLPAELVRCRSRSG